MALNFRIKIPSHRALAIFRGRKSNILDVSIDILLEDEQTSHPAILKIQAFNDWTHQDRAADKWLSEVFTWTWKVKLQNQLQNELLSEIKELADTESIKVFAQNLSNLLMSAPAGEKNTLGLDPGLRTGVKVAAVDDTGKLLSHTTIFPHAPKNEWDASIETLNKLCQTHNIKLISIGNGTASRETENLVKELKAKYPDWGYQGVVVSEAGASVYSASAYAAKEFPDLDVSFRGAVSIARRLQDPLAELVKIEPKSIGVGQYQHDVNQRKLSRNLDTVVEDCVNSVGVDVNTASVALLSRISGLNTTIAGNIVNYRDKHGRFKNREALKKIPRFGNKTFEQAAGFLRLKNGDHPLDQSGVHPESYKLVESIAEKYNKALDLIIGDSQFLAKISPEEFANEQFGLPTIKDILTELEKPGRDPRPEFKTANFSSDVNTIDDLKSGMILEGVISNVTNFGAFVNVGVHQDGLVHISALSSNFVKDPHQIVKAGDIVKVKVLEVDQSLKRISLTMKLNEEAKQDISKPSRNKIKPEKKNPPPKAKQQTKKKTKEKSGTAFDKKGAKPALPPGKTGTFADLFANAMNKDNKH